MSETPTGTDRGGCTCGEGDAAGDTTPGPCFVDASGFTVHRPRTDEHEDHGKHLRGLWRDLADKDIQHGVDWPGVVRVLFADIDALTAGVEFSTGTDRVELTEDEREALLFGFSIRFYENADHTRFPQGIAAVESIVAARLAALTAERDELRGIERQCGEEHGPLLRENKTLTDELAAARAELAAANARCAELEAKVEGYSYWSMVQKNAALQATLDRVTALPDEWEAAEIGVSSPDTALSGNECAADLRAALTPDGKP